MSGLEGEDLSDDERRSRSPSRKTAALASSVQSDAGEHGGERLEEQLLTPPRPTRGRQKRRRAAGPEGERTLKKVESVLEVDTLAAKIQDLRRQQEEAKATRARIAKDMRNTARRQSRLRSKTKLMSDEDLLQVLMMRKTSRETAAARAATASGSGLSEAVRDVVPVKTD